MIILNEDDKYIFRTIKPGEEKIVWELEQKCFSQNVADDYFVMTERGELAPEFFVVAIDKSTDSIIAYLNGIGTNETKFRDEFYEDNSLHDPNGKNVMLLALGVLPEYRGQGIARQLMNLYGEKEQENGRNNLYLICHEDKIQMYKKMGYQYIGPSDAKLGNEEWHDMVKYLNK